MSQPPPPPAKVKIEECPIGTPGSALFLFPVYDESGCLDYAASEKNSFAIRKVEANGTSQPRHARQ